MANPRLADLLTLSICAGKIWTLAAIEMPGAVMRERGRVEPGESEI
ncbi:hypothetical protein J2X36_005252 [Methylobacterium sp. BE186]|nr:hypothetical protein [Methylobacterium sp. BE186]MDR7040469.1 hypothetical protein [Methylobacterium sp. BE186]